MKKLALPKSYGKPMENATPMQSPKLGYGKPHGKPQIKTLWKALWKAQKTLRVITSKHHTFLVAIFDLPTVLPTVF